MILGFIIRIALLMLGLAACFAILNYFVKGSKNRVSGKGADPLEESKESNESKEGSTMKSFPEGSATEAAASALMSMSTIVSSSIETGDASIDATEDSVVVDEEIVEVIKDDDEDEDAAAGEEKEEDEEKTKATSES